MLMIKIIFLIGRSHGGGCSTMNFNQLNEDIKNIERNENYGNLSPLRKTTNFVNKSHKSGSRQCKFLISNIFNLVF